MLENLKKLRWQKGISQQKLADAIFVSQQSVNKYENHDVEPDIEVLIRIADYFDTSIDYLVGRTQKIEPEAASSPVSLTPNEQKMLKSYHSLTTRQKESLLLLLEAFHEHS